MNKNLGGTIMIYLGSLFIIVGLSILFLFGCFNVITSDNEEVGKVKWVSEVKRISSFNNPTGFCQDLIVEVEGKEIQLQNIQTGHKGYRIEDEIKLLIDDKDYTKTTVANSNLSSLVFCVVLIGVGVIFILLRNKVA